MWVWGTRPAASEESCDPHQQTWVEPSLPHSPELSGGTASALSQIVSFAAGMGGQISMSLPTVLSALNGSHGVLQGRVAGETELRGWVEDARPQM